MATINYLTTVEFDFGAVAKLADSVRTLGIRKPMLVTDAGLADGAVMARVLEAITQLEPVIFDGTPQNPDEQAVEDARRAVQGKCLRWRNRIGRWLADRSWEGSCTVGDTRCAA